MACGENKIRLSCTGCRVGGKDARPRVVHSAPLSMADLLVAAYWNGRMVKETLSGGIAL